MILLGLDIGTTALKCTAFDIYGKLLAVSTKKYTLEMPEVGYVELDAEIYWKALEDCMADLKTQVDFSKDKLVMAFSAQGETLICLDNDGNPTRRAIVWMDNRASEEAKMLEDAFGNERCYEVTGQVKFTANWPASKILWIRRHEPDVFEKTDKFLMVEDYLIYKLTGKFVSEASLMSTSVYWNIIDKAYWKEMIDFLGITERQLPLVYEPGAVVGNMLPKVKKAFGLTGKITISTGALDQAAGAISVGNIHEGMFSESMDDALTICTPLNSPVYDPNRRMPLQYFAIPDMYMLQSFTTGGLILKWYRDQFCDIELGAQRLGAGNAYDLISAQVEKIAPGSEGLLMLPYLAGASAPDANDAAKGVWYGFTLKHTKAHFARSVMEGLGYILRRNMEALKEMGIHVEEIRAFGGGARSTVWNQIKADITKTRIVTMHSEETLCLGAAILAGKSVGVFDSIESAVMRMVCVKGYYEGRKAYEAVYDRDYSLFCRLLKDLGGCFEQS